MGSVAFLALMGPAARPQAWRSFGMAMEREGVDSEFFQNFLNFLEKTNNMRNFYVAGHPAVPLHGSEHPRRHGTRRQLFSERNSWRPSWRTAPVEWAICIYLCHTSWGMINHTRHTRTYIYNIYTYRVCMFIWPYIYIIHIEYYDGPAVRI